MGFGQIAVGRSAAVCSAVFALAACAMGAEDEPSARAVAVRDASCWARQLPWGDDDGQVGLVPAAPERAARGPQAVAVGPAGEILVLDAEHSRVVAVDRDGVRVVAGDVPRSAEDLAVGPDGALAIHSPLEAAVWIRGPNGAPAGEVRIPRVFRHVAAVSLGSSRRVSFRTAYQETFAAGSPAAPLRLAEMLHSKREGAVPLPDGSGLAVRARTDGTAELVGLRAGDRDRQRVVLRHPLPGSITAGRVLGVDADTACIAAERVVDATPIRVERRVICVRVDTGRVAADLPLPPPGIYQPRREVAIGGGRIASIHATGDGLVVRSCPIPVAAEAEVQP